MKQHWGLACLTALSVSTVLVVTDASAQGMRGGPGGGGRGGVSIGGGGGPGGGARMSGAIGGAPRAGIVQQGGPRMGGPGVGMAGARIEPRIRSGAVDMRRDGFQRGYVPGAAPLTISRDRRVVTDGRYRYGRHYDYRRHRYYDRGWYPGLLAAPFLFPFGYGYDYDYDYGPVYYDPYIYDEPGYSVPVGSYGGALGNHCATPQKVCKLYSPAEIGLGCSCRAPAGLPRFRGTVVP